MSVHEDSRAGSPDPALNVDFLSVEVSDYDVRSVNASQKEVAKFLTKLQMEFHSVFYFLR
jgi:hypothetical protein